MGALFACVLIAAGAVAFNKYRRGLRKRLTQQFVMKKGLSIGKTVDKADLVSWWTFVVWGFAGGTYSCRFFLGKKLIWAWWIGNGRRRVMTG